MAKGASGVTTYAANITIGAGNDRMLLVHSYVLGDYTGASTATFNGVAMTNVASGRTQNRVHILPNPDVGTYELALAGASGSGNGIMVAAVCLNGVSPSLTLPVCSQASTVSSIGNYRYTTVNPGGRDYVGAILGFITDNPFVITDANEFVVHGYLQTGGGGSPTIFVSSRTGSYITGNTQFAFTTTANSSFMLVRFALAPSALSMTVT